MKCQTSSQGEGVPVSDGGRAASAGVGSAVGSIGRFDSGTKAGGGSVRRLDRSFDALADTDSD